MNKYKVYFKGYVILKACDEETAADYVYELMQDANFSDFEDIDYVEELESDVY